MKNLKKMFAVVIAMVMALAMGISVFAANEINGADYDTAYFTVGAKKVDLIGHTFNAVQIIKIRVWKNLRLGHMTRPPRKTGTLNLSALISSTLGSSLASRSVCSLPR